MSRTVHMQQLNTACARLAALQGELSGDAATLIELGAALVELGAKRAVNPEVDIFASDEIPVLLQRLEKARTRPAPDWTESWRPPKAKRPRVSRQRQRVSHRLDWLPERPFSTDEQVDLFFWTGRSWEDLQRDGIRVPDLFLLGHLDPESLERKGGEGIVLKLTVPAGIAVDPLSHHDILPSSLARRLAAHPDQLLIPLVHFPSVAIMAGYKLDASRGFGPPFPGPFEFNVTVDGAEHGVPGLPNEVVAWPDNGKQESSEAYLALPTTSRPAWLPMYQQRPRAKACVVKVTVPNHKAIDVPSSLKQLSQIPLLRKPLRRFGDLELILPRSAFASAVVCEVHRQNRRELPHLRPGQRLSECLA